MSDEKQAEVVLGPGALDEKLAAREAKVAEKNAETTTYVTEENSK